MGQAKKKNTSVYKFIFLLIIMDYSANNVQEL